MTTEFVAKTLNEAIGRVEHAVADEETRPILATILFEGSSTGFRLVAADNYRLAIATLSEDDYSDFGRVPLAAAFIPTLRAFLRAFPKLTVTLKVDGQRLVVDNGIASVSLRLVDGMYPNYEAVVPNGGPIFGINPTYLADATRAAKGLPVARIHKGDGVGTPFVVEAEGYREAIMAVRLVDSVA